MTITKLTPDRMIDIIEIMDKVDELIDEIELLKNKFKNAKVNISF